MSKYSDMVALLEWAEKRKTPDKPKRWRREKNDDDPMAILIKAKRFADEWDKFQKDQEKIHKKEEKKEDKKGWDGMSFVQKVAVLTFTVPLATMGYGLIFIAFAKAAANMMH